MTKSATRTLSVRWLALGLIVSLGFLALLIHSIDLARSWEILSRIDGQRFWLPIAITVAAIPLRPWRWQVMFLQTARPRWISCFGTLAAGNLANNLLPGRGGDLLRCFLISGSRSLGGASTVFGTLALEKFCDGFALLGVVLLSGFFFSPPRWLWQLGMASSLVFGLAIVLLGVLSRHVSKLLSLLSQRLRLGAFGEKLVDLFELFAEGFSASQSTEQMSRLVLLTLLVWMSEAAVLWSLAFTLQIQLSLLAAAFVSASLGLGLMIPAGPGFVGTYEFFSVAALRLFGIGPESALALTLLMHAWSILVTTVMGIVGLSFMRVKFIDLLGSRYADPLVEGVS